ncbi:hypothetical protein AGRA3207_004970 [Actinomadura graeca]|uniref:Regulatory protein n=1 Tax=Actinomadura graeca TaxID=2750812 RepID=A0ABX8R0H8_9ACTN|nr:hypothetical protein [Actinomadura graeca]QXJ23769.1 hypothetical protein AGRA3207_004970 [Actinomadura graeca]
MSGMSPAPSNDRLRALLAEAEWTGGRLAQAVNAVGAEAGLGLRYGRASVTQWMSGTRPRDPGPALIAEALSRRLGRSLGIVDTGFEGAEDAYWSMDLPAQLTELAAAAGTDRQAARRVCVYRLADCRVPGWQEIRDGRIHRGGPSPESGGPEMELAHTMVRLFSEVDRSHGGGVLRAPASAFLSHVGGPWCRTPPGDSRRAEFLGVCSRLAHVCGFMSFDDQAHGPAQRFYRASLRTAAEAGHREEYAWALRAMSVQAHDLGHFRQALELIETAASPRLTVLTRASLAGQAAVALASTGSRRRALAELLRAEELLGRAPETPARPVGSYHPAELSFQRALVHSHLNDRRAALTALRESLARWPPAERRSRAITLARIAEFELEQGLLEEAVATAHRFLDDYSYIRSARIRRFLAGLRARLRPYGNSRAAGALLHRAVRVADASTAFSAP